MPRSRRLEIVLAGDASGALSSLVAVDRAAGRTSTGMQRLGRFGAAGLTALGAGAVAAAGALYSIGSQFDSAYDRIRVGTGATGRQMAQLQNDFRAVARSSYSNFGDISTAITGVNQRLGLTGRPLQQLTRQLTDLSRITETDVNTNVANMTRLFGDWDVPARRMSSTLDEIFRASQSSGVGLDQLSSQVVQFGAPMRNLGFDLEETLALFSKWEAEGVNIGTAMGGMRRAVASFAQDGISPMEGFRQVMADVEAGTFSMSDAMEIFGTRAGPDMFAALTEGRFSLDDLLASIRGGRDTIAQASRDTADFGEKWQNLKNRVFLALEPIASRVFDAVGAAMDDLGPAVDRLTTWFREDLAPVIERVWPRISDVISDAAQNIGSIISEVVTTVRVVWARWGDDLMAVVNRVWPPIRDIITSTTQIIRGVIHTVLSLIRGDWSGVWEGIKETFGGIWDNIVARVRLAIEIVRSTISTAWNAVRAVTSTVWNAIPGLVSAGVQAVVGFMQSIPGRVTGLMRSAWEGAKNAVGAAWDWITRRARDGVDGIMGFISGLPARIRGVIERVVGAARDIGAGIIRGIGRGLSNVASFAGDLAAAAGRAFRGAVNLVIDLLNDAIPNRLGWGPVAIDIPDDPIPHLAAGGTARQGGLALVGERGAEVVRLGAGDTVFPHDASRRAMRGAGGQVAPDAKDGKRQVDELLAMAKEGSEQLGELWRTQGEKILTDETKAWQARLANQRTQQTAMTTVAQTGGSQLVATWNQAASRTTAALRSGYQQMRGATAAGVNAIGGAWSGIRGAIGRPTAQVISGVINPFLGGFRRIAGTVGLANSVPGNMAVPRFHSGGVVPGRGEVPAVLLGGEAVLTADGLELLGGRDVLERLNSGGMADRAGGGGGHDGTRISHGTNQTFGGLPAHPKFGIWPDTGQRGGKDGTRISHGTNQTFGGLAAHPRFGRGDRSVASVGSGRFGHPGDNLEPGSVTDAADRLPGLMGQIARGTVQGMANLDSIFSSVRSELQRIVGLALPGGMAGQVFGTHARRPVRELLDHLTEIQESLVPPIPALGAPVGPWGVDSGLWRAMWAAVSSHVPGLSLISAFRATMTATGNPSRHGLGRAIDIGGNLWGAFNWIRANYPNSYELIFSPAGGAQLYRGAPHIYSEPTRGDHWDHVHWSLHDGTDGWVRVRRPTPFVVGDRPGGEYLNVSPAGPGGGTTVVIDHLVEVNVDGDHIDDVALAQLLESAVRRGVSLPQLERLIRRAASN